MHTLRQRYLVAIVLIGIVAPIVLFFQYDVPPPASIGPIKGAIPSRLGQWGAIADRGPTDQEREILETDAILTRTYACGGPTQCDLSVIFAQDNRRVAHPPELCYKGAGWNVESKQVVTVPVGGQQAFAVNRLLLLRGDGRMWVLYWYKAGDRCSANYVVMQWNIIKSHLLHRSSSSALLRVSAISRGPDDDAEVLAALCQFASIAIPAVNAAIP